MKTYTLNTRFTFGQFQSKTLREVLDIDVTYVNWCIANLDHFYLSNETIDEIKSIKANFNITEGQRIVLAKRLAESKMNLNNSYNGYEKPTYNQYGGSYAQDIEGWSDQDINDAFGGEADAYWNID